MESFFDLLESKNIYNTPIARKLTNSAEEEIFINEMGRQLLISNKADILYIVNKIITRELNKRPHLNVCGKLLLKNQIYSNLIENITTIVLNLSKDYYEENYEENTTTENSQVDLFEQMTIDNESFVPITF
jgi:hypothetical protein